ncbi:response regulator transcription factor [Terriglobus saanensis]|uniref:response regulator transcription factor n=1 Tax=Terriglobus saanensis TaxID=870903 RepID=UPI001FDEC6D3|nr:response regulator transcription factor [Terriglobus saanensis]
MEDDLKLSSVLRDALERKAYRVTVAYTGSEGLALGIDFEFEFILLDAMLPEMDGFSVARSLRQSGISTQILMLTSRDSTSDIVRGLDSGVDDYLTKPFSFEELFARLRALARRRMVPHTMQYEVGDLCMDPVTHTATRAGRALSLTRTEHLLLEFMMRSPNVVLRRDAIINAVWGYETTVENNTLDAFMKQLRFKVDNEHKQKLIRTVRGFGFKLSAGDQ